jgi:hypothetical protein
LQFAVCTFSRASRSAFCAANPLSLQTFRPSTSVAERAATLPSSQHPAKHRGTRRFAIAIRRRPARHAPDCQSQKVGAAERKVTSTRPSVRRQRNATAPTPQPCCPTRAVVLLAPQAVSYSLFRSPPSPSPPMPPNPSIERTHNGGARCPAPSRVVTPLCAAHVKR